MWLPYKTMNCFYYAKHPALTMSYHWKDCCRLSLNVYAKFTKLIATDDSGIAEKMVYHCGVIKQCVLAAFGAQTLEAALELLQKMYYAKNNCLHYHFEAQKHGLYTNYADEEKILKPIIAMGFYQMALTAFFKRKFKPPKAHTRLSHHYELRRVLNYKPRNTNTK